MKKLFKKLKNDHGCFIRAGTAIVGMVSTFVPCFCTLFMGAVFDERYAAYVEAVERLSETSLSTTCKTSTARSFTQDCKRRPGGLRLTFAKAQRKASVWKKLKELSKKHIEGKMSKAEYEEKTAEAKSKDIVACRMRLTLEQRVCTTEDPIRGFDYSCNCDAKQSRAVGTEMLPVRFLGGKSKGSEREFKKVQTKAKCPHWFVSWDNAARSIFTFVTTAKFNQQFATCNN